MPRVFFIIALLAAAACQPGDGAARTEPVIITVLAPQAAGAAPAGGLFERYGLSGPASGYKRADLQALESREIAASYPPGAPQATWRGPLLSAVLDAAGAPGAGAALTALDGYAVEVSAEDIRRYEPILALTADGKALATGGLGPAVLIWPQDFPGPQSQEGAAAWVWGVFALEARAPGAAAPANIP